MKILLALFISVSLSQIHTFLIQSTSRRRNWAFLHKSSSIHLICPVFCHSPPLIHPISPPHPLTFLSPHVSLFPSGQSAFFTVVVRESSLAVAVAVSWLLACSFSKPLTLSCDCSSHTHFNTHMHARAHTHTHTQPRFAATSVHLE